MSSPEQPSGWQAPDSGYAYPNEPTSPEPQSPATGSPAHGSPATGSPNPGAQAPGYGAPSYGAPSYGAPTFGAAQPGTNAPAPGGMQPPAGSDPANPYAYLTQPPEQPQEAAPPFSQGAQPGLQMAFPELKKAKLEPTAIASLATFWAPIVGLVLGVVALLRTRKRGTRSPALATVATALGAFVTVGAIVVVTALAANGTFARWSQAPEAGDLSERTISSIHLAAGNCIATLPPGDEVGDVKIVPCAQEHAAQVVAVAPLTASSYPEATVIADSAAACEEDIEAVLTAFPDTPLTPWYLAPSKSGWDAGNTSAICMVRTTATPLTVDVVN